jgi:hypothetical protein
MIDSTQILLIVVITTLTILLTAIGLQVFFILREVRRSIEKMNKILDDAGRVSESIAKPIASITGSLGSLSGLTGLFGWLANRRKKENLSAKETNE